MALFCYYGRGIPAKVGIMAGQRTDQEYEQFVRAHTVMKVEDLSGRGVALKLIHTPSSITGILTWQRRSTSNREKLIDEMLAPLGLMAGPDNSIVPFLTKLERGRAS